MAFSCTGLWTTGWRSRVISGQVCYILYWLGPMEWRERKKIQLGIQLNRYDKKNHKQPPNQVGIHLWSNQVHPVHYNRARLNVGLYIFEGESTSQVIGARNEWLWMIMMAKWYSGILGPKASWHLSYGWGKTPKKPHPGNLSRPGIEPGPAAWQARMLPPIPQRWTTVGLT